MIKKENLDKTSAWPFVEAKKMLRERKSIIEKKGKMSFKESTLVETKNNQINIIREGSLSKKLINEELKNFNKKHY